MSTSSLKLIDDLIDALTIDFSSKLISLLNKGVGCLDTRKSVKYYLSNATFINEEELEDRVYELPIKCERFILIAHSNESAKILQKNEYKNFIEFKLKNNNKKWNILSKALITNNNSQNINVVINDNNKKHQLLYIPLFNPCCTLKSNIDLIEKRLIENNKYECCDIGCGSGRNAIYLALRNNWNVDCIDFNHKMLKRLIKFASKTNVSDSINPIKSKIKGDENISVYKNIDDSQPFYVYDMNNNENKESESDFYFNKSYDLVVCSRFLDRGLIHKLWKKGKMIKTNGFLLIFTFLEGSDKIGARHPKNPNYLLKYNELKQTFENENKVNNNKMWNIIKNEVVYTDDGRPMNGFLVQKL